jgi:hypothetical protein
MVRDVTPEKAAPVTHPHGAFVPERTAVAHAVPDALQGCVKLPFEETLVHYPCGLRVGDRDVTVPVAVTGEFIRRCQGPSRRGEGILPKY